MKCSIDNYNTTNKKSFSNHLRKHNGTSAKGVSMNVGSKNGMWKGDEVGYLALHEWVNNHINKPKVCKDCGATENIDLANITGVYNRDLNNWAYLCRSDHMKNDGRLKQLQENLKRKRGERT